MYLNNELIAEGVAILSIDSKRCPIARHSIGRPLACTACPHLYKSDRSDN